MRKNNQTTMQSEIFIVLMIVAILLFIIGSVTLTNIKEEKEKLAEQKISLQDVLSKYNIDKDEANKLKKIIDKLEKEKIILEGQKISLQEILQKYTLDKDEVDKLKKIVEKFEKHKQPPLITLDEASGYAFNSGLANLSDEFQKNLYKMITKIKTYAQKYNCDTIEVYGYTDGQPFASVNGTAKFDKELHLCLENSGCEINKIKPSSNLELGMQRAVSVANFLKSNLLPEQNIKIVRPYSGGQFINSNGKIAPISNSFSNSSRRRIEIRLSRSRDFKSK